MSKIATILLNLLGAAAGPEVREGWFRIEIPDGAPVTGLFLGRGSTWAGAKVDLDGVRVELRRYRLRHGRRKARKIYSESIFRGFFRGPGRGGRCR